ncbi:GUstatory Receptor family [Aphelenchoides besseyi]|nr:GUstatory Receptor family [Aphelenchoides besseyi]
MSFCSRLHKIREDPSLYLNRLGFLNVVLCKTFLVYDYPGQSALVKSLRILRAAFLMLIVFYQLSWVTYFIINKRGDNIERSLVLLNWLLQAFISMCFIIYWQRRNVLRQLAQVVPWENVAMSEESGLKNRVCKAALVFFGFFITCVLSLIFSAVVEYFYGAAPHYDLELTEAYGNTRFRFVFYVVTFYAMTVWLTSMSLYVVVSITVHQELEKFNETLKDIGEDRTRDEVGDQLLDRYSKHVELSEIVRSVDNAFEVYTFAMLGTNIPTSVFTLLSFYRSLNTGQWYDIALSCPELMFCIVQIVGLTIQPARVYGAIRQIESIIYGNQRIWMPYSASVYQIANVFVSHANQQGLGISIWGFAVVTKPMILTTTSLVLTYLTLLIQMNGPNHECENVLAIMNHTA